MKLSQMSLFLAVLGSTGGRNSRRGGHDPSDAFSEATRVLFSKAFVQISCADKFLMDKLSEDTFGIVFQFLRNDGPTRTDWDDWSRYNIFFFGTLERKVCFPLQAAPSYSNHIYFFSAQQNKTRIYFFEKL